MGKGIKQGCLHGDFDDFNSHIKYSEVLIFTLLKRQNYKLLFSRFFIFHIFSNLTFYNSKEKLTK